MKQKHTAIRPEVLSLLTLAVLSVCLYLFTSIQYSLNDDTVLMRSFAGNVGGVMESFNMFTHTLLAFVLHHLSVAFPLVAWYSVAQVACLCAAGYSLLCSVQRILLRTGAKAWLAWLVSTVNLLCFGMVFMCSITFTTTVALLSAAAVWKVLAIDFSAGGGRVARAALCSFALLAMGYMLRNTAALPGVCFWAMALVGRALIRPQQSKPLRAPLLILLLGLGALGALYAIRAADMAASGEQAYIRWMEASVAGMDYGGIRNADLSLLHSIGWTRKEQALVLDWYFMEDNITAETFAAFAPYANHGTPERCAVGADAPAGAQPQHLLLCAVSGVEWRGGDHGRSLCQTDSKVGDFIAAGYGCCGAVGRGRAGVHRPTADARGRYRAVARLRADAVALLSGHGAVGGR